VSGGGVQRKGEQREEIRLEEGKRGFASAAAVSCYCLLRKTRGFCLQQEVARTGNSGEPQCREAEQRQRRKRKGISRGLVCNFRKLQGPLGKEEFNHCSRAQTKM
jgi:hypothetical protein